MVTILLATLNGEDYLKAQLESIAAQTYENWQLVVGDDGSTDGTISILEEFSKQYPEQVTIIKNDPPQGSAKDNFISLIQNSYGINNFINLKITKSAFLIITVLIFFSQF